MTFEWISRAEAIRRFPARGETMSRNGATSSDRRTIRGLRDNMRSALAEIGKLQAEGDCLRAWQNGQIQGLNRLSDEIRHKNDLIDRLTRANAELHKAVEVEKGFAGKLADAVHALLSAQYREGQIKRWSAADFARAARIPRFDGEFAEVGEAAIGTAHKT